MTYDLEFDIAPELYARAVTQPIDGRPTGRAVIARNVAAALLGSLSVTLFTLAVFDLSQLPAVLMGAVLGATLVLAVWWRQHRTLVKLHGTYNDTGGRHRMQIDADRIIASRPYIQSRIEWPFVRQVRQIEGAVLIELPTARLIIPTAALGESGDAFAAQLNAWRTA